MSRICRRCGRHVPQHRSRYCGDRCQRAARRARWREARAESLAAEDARRAVESRERSLAWQRFVRATVSSSRIRVPADAVSQARARALIGAGLGGYENAQGLVCDVAQVKRARDAGAVWSRRKRVDRDRHGRLVGDAS